MVFSFFTETWKPHKGPKISLLATFKDIRLVFHQKTLRVILITNLFFVIGWAFYLVFSPTFLVQKFSLKSDQIGGFFAYMAVCWCFASMYLNKELVGKFSLRTLILAGMLIGAASLILFLCPSNLWPYWIILPINQLGALAWVNLGATLSAEASPQMQGRAMGASGSSWSFGQTIAPLIAGPLAGWNIYAPLTLGAAFILLAFFYFGARFKHET
jgi:predicted MFS family arabinose efflux permease